MDSTANEEQRMLLDYTQRFINDVHPLERVREQAFADPAYSADYLQRSAELGWYSMLVPEELGGGCLSDNGLVDAAMIAAKRGSGLQPGSFTGTNVVAFAIARAGTDNQHSEGSPSTDCGRSLCGLGGRCTSCSRIHWW